MKLMVRSGCLILGILLLTIQSKAQDFENLIKGSIRDANVLVEGYLSPAFKAFGTGLNQGWYNTAKTHKKFGFDLTISVAGVTIPSSDNFFTVDNATLSEIALKTDHSGVSVSANGQGSVPTISGPKETQSTYEFRNSSFTYKGLGGIDLEEELNVRFLPIAVYSFGFGLPKGIELRFRFIPTINIDVDNYKSETNYFGMGLMHDVKQYIPGMKMLPFDLSAFAGYSRMNIDVAFDKSTYQTVVSATTIQSLISKKISVLTVYGGVGYDFTKSNFKVIGEYDLDGNPSNGAEATDPVNINVASSGPRATAGIRLKFAFFTLHGDYTLQKYNAFSAGFGFSFR